MKTFVFVNEKTGELMRHVGGEVVMCDIDTADCWTPEEQAQRLADGWSNWQVKYTPAVYVPHPEYALV